MARTNAKQRDRSRVTASTHISISFEMVCIVYIVYAGDKFGHYGYAVNAVGNGVGLHAPGGVCKAGGMLDAPTCKHVIWFARPEKLTNRKGNTWFPYQRLS